MKRLLIALFVVVAVFQLWLVNERWVNPDEGNHLYAARLALEGQVPYAEFPARQPLYLYTLSGLIYLLGNSLVWLRLFPVVCKLASAVLVYLITRKIYSERAAIISSAAFLIAPIGLLWSTVIKTEPYSVLLVCLAVYLFIKSKHFWSGLFFGGALLVRESVAFAALGFILYAFYRKRGAWQLAGTAAPILAAFLLLAAIAGPEALWQSNLNPLNKLASQSIALGTDQPLARAFHELLYALYFSSFLVLASALFVMKGLSRKHAIPLIWLAGIAAFYALFFLKRGFFNQYSYELLPAMSIMFGVVWVGSEAKLKVILASLLALSFALFSPSFGCVWSLDTVDAVSQELQPGSTALSGTLIWQFSSGSDAYLNMTNTLGFRGGMSEEQREKITEALLTQPPDYIILDGYTELNFMDNLPVLGQLLPAQYRPVYEDLSSRLPVRVFRSSQSGGAKNPLCLESVTTVTI